MGLAFISMRELSPKYASKNYILQAAMYCVLNNRRVSCLYQSDYSLHRLLADRLNISDSSTKLGTRSLLLSRERKNTKALLQGVKKILPDSKVRKISRILIAYINIHSFVTVLNFTLVQKLLSEHTGFISSV